MPFLIPKPGAALDAFELAQERDILPSALGSQEQRETFAAELRAKSVYAARATNAIFLESLKKVVNAITQGEMSVPEGRAVLGETLEALGYTPESGFPGDVGEVPPAVEGTLQDLRSRRRLDLIIRTQTELMQGRGQLHRGRDTISVFPYWELVRIEEREVPRDWAERFEEAGGVVLVDGEGRQRLIAHKNDPVWDALGDSALFNDALDVNHPPFAFGSGMGWREISRAEFEALGGAVVEVKKRESSEEMTLPANVGVVRDEGELSRLQKIFKTVDLDGKRARVAELRELDKKRAREAYGL